MDDIAVRADFYCLTHYCGEKPMTYCCSAVVVVICLSTQNTPCPGRSPAPSAPSGADGGGAVWAGKAPSSDGRSDVLNGTASDG